MKTKTVFWLSSIVLILTGFYSCKSDGTGENSDTGKIAFRFKHVVDSSDVQRYKMIYTNAAGNKYRIDDIRYFISDVTLYRSDKTKKVIEDWQDIYYVDIGYPNTLIWQVFDKIPSGSYDSVTFIFGITAEKNISMMYTNMPESAMMWPDILGGGYHYMMINGAWINNHDSFKFFNFHLGIGQLYKQNIINTDSIYGYVQNYFKVKLPNSSFTIEKDKTRTIEIVMHVDSWFKTPHIYDHNIYGSDIMQNQTAMNIAKENGFDVFTVGKIE